MTWILIPLLVGRKSTGYKSIFKFKYNKNDSMKYYKTRLSTKDYLQKEDIDFNTTFAIFIKMTFQTCFS